MQTFIAADATAALHKMMYVTLQGSYYHSPFTAVPSLLLPVGSDKTMTIHICVKENTHQDIYC